MKRRFVSRLSILSLLLFLLSLGVYIICLSNTTFADAVVSTLGMAVRRSLAALTGFLPFSLFEIILLLSPVIIVLVVIGGIRALRTPGGIIRYPLSVLAVISLIGTLFIYTLGISYKTTKLDVQMSLDTSEENVSGNLIETAFYIRGKVNEYANGLSAESGYTEMPYGIRELSRRLSSAFDTLSEEYSFIEGHTGYVKPVIFSTVMSDAGITGIYSFPTGEANVNTEYPDYYLPFTAAHEMAHARGIAREDEASFVAFLVCISSDDEYIRYSGYLNLYEYIISPVKKADNEAYKSLTVGLSDVAKADISAAREVYLRHADSKLGEINDKVNDAYLQANGQDGVISYGYVVKLSVAYLSAQSEN